MNGRYLFYFFSVICFVLMVFTNLGDHQLEFFDEARRGVSALEMYTGKSHPLVPTYAGAPDHWGTKPPLLIWLQTTAIYLMGPGELPIRLPSALATLLAIGLMAWFTARQWKTAVIGVLAGWILLTNWDFMGNHGARSGDYDALLLLFCLGQLLFFARFVRTNRHRYLYLSAISLLLAGWTKGIAACLFLPAIGLWVLIDPDARKQLFNWRLYLAYGLALLGILSYYFLREQVDPGYLQLVWENELGGRYLETNEQHVQPWYHYIVRMVTDRTFGIFAQLAIPAAVFVILRKRDFKDGGLLALALFCFLAVISYSATKLFWYQVPVLPLIALLVAALLYSLGQLIGRKLQDHGRPWAIAAVLLLMAGFFTVPYSKMIYKIDHPAEFQGLKKRLSSYRSVIESDSMPQPYTVLVHHYHPSARFYAYKEALKGYAVTFTPINKLVLPLVSIPTDYVKLAPGNRVLICESNAWDWMAKNYTYEQIAEKEYCKLVEITAIDPDIKPRHLPK